MTQEASTSSLSEDSVHVILGAIRFGTRAYPGPVGELIERELRAYVENGRQLSSGALPERLLAGLSSEAEALRTHESTSTAHMLPARYRKGSPLRWEYTPRPIASDTGTKERED